MSRRNQNIVYDKEFTNCYINELAKYGLSWNRKTDAAKSVSAVFSALEVLLSEGKAVSRQGFGKFEIRHRKSRWGRNPHTNDRIRLPEVTTVGFKPGSELKNAVSYDNR